MATATVTAISDEFLAASYVLIEFELSKIHHIAQANLVYRLAVETDVELEDMSSIPCPDFFLKKEKRKL